MYIINRRTICAISGSHSFPHLGVGRSERWPKFMRHNINIYYKLINNLTESLFGGPTARL